MSKVYNQKIVYNRPVAQDIYKMIIKCDKGVLEEFNPGQFAHIKINYSTDLLLRRPISVHSVNYENNEMSFIYAITGIGTKRLTEINEGDFLDVLMPLGNGFKIETKAKNIWLIGGGIGCAPLLSVTDKFVDKNYKIFLGFRSKNQIYSLEDFNRMGDIFITTDDGSSGEKGIITSTFERELKKHNPDLVLSCGPNAFFKSLKKLAEKYNMEVQASLEQRMGCGTGGCSVCVCSVNGAYQKVCSEGPVFDLREVDLID